MPDFPGYVRDVIFHGAAAGLTRVSPVVLGDELFEASFRGQRRRSAGMRLKFATLISRSPRIFRFHFGVFRKYAMGHQPANVIFVVDYARGERDTMHGNN